MINYKYTVSLESGSNKVISSSEDKFTGIANGTLIKFNNDINLHTVTGKDSFFLIKDFIAQNSKTLILDGDCRGNIQKMDSIQISFKEYESVLLLDIIDKGINYHNDDLLFVSGGTTSVDIFSPINNSTVLNVIETDLSGGITKLNIKNSGKYLYMPENPVKVYGGKGENLIVELKYNEILNRSIITRTITDIYFSENKTFIIIDYSLPPNLKSGKFSIQKNILHLSTPYTGETGSNISYQIYKDFTPNIKLPLMVKGCISPEVVYNRACMILDAELTKIKDYLKI